jgi:hypothetical protein
LVAHLHFLPTQEPNKKMQMSYQANAPKTLQTMDRQETTERTPKPKSTYQKAGFRVPKTVLWLIKH